MSHPDLKAEQEYVDHAYACLERMREIVLRAGDAADGEVAQAALDAWAAKRLATFEDAERGLMFGRLDFEAVERPLYVGRRWVHDDEGEQIVVNWQAPLRGPSTPRHRRIRSASRSGAASVRRDASSSTSPTRRSTARRWTAPVSATSYSRSSSATATRTCATSSRRSRPTSTA